MNNMRRPSVATSAIALALAFLGCGGCGGGSSTRTSTGYDAGPLGDGSPTGGSTETDGATATGESTGGSAGTGGMGTGGTSGSAGLAGAGGTVGTMGGSTSSGATIAAGGTAGSGGIVAFGGTVGTGGGTGSRDTIATDAATSAGGMVASGGTVGLGGGTGSRDTIATGATTGSGGIFVSGGTVSTGGTTGVAGTISAGAATSSGGMNSVGGTVGTDGGGGVSSASATATSPAGGAAGVPPGSGGGGGAAAGGSGSAPDDAGATTSADAPAVTDATAGDDTDSGTAGPADASGDTGTTTTAGIVSFASGGSSLEVLAVPGQVILFLRSDVGAADAQQLVEGSGGLLLDAGAGGGLCLVQVSIGSEGQYIAAMEDDSRVLLASPNVISALDTSATVLEADCSDSHASAVRSVFSQYSGSSEQVGCLEVRATYSPEPTVAAYAELNVFAQIKHVLDSGGCTGYVNTSFGPSLRSAEAALADLRRECRPSELHLCRGDAQILIANSRFVAWRQRLQAVATCCPPDGPPCNAVLSMSAGNDDVALDDVLNSLRNADPDLAKVLHNNAVIVGVNGAINWGPSNHLPWADFDFIVATNPEAVRGTWSDGTPLAGNPPGGTSFAAPFVLGLVSRKAESLKDPNNPALAAVADAEALCMVKTAAKNRGWLADGDYVNITERCCLDRPAGERDDKVHCCRPGQTWNADTGACGAACAILDQSLTDLEFGTYAPHMSYSAAITIVNSGDESASVTVNSDSTGSDGSPPPFMVANTLADPSTKTVSAGGSATFTVTFTAPEIPNEYDATISFGVTGTQCSAAIRSVHVHASVISITPP